MAHVGNTRPSLGNPATGAAEQLVALKFLLHFVGDLHQPLHAADDHDAGGNKKLVAGERVHRGNLHHYWDVEFVERLGTDPSRVASNLIDRISEPQRQEWSRGAAEDWAMEAFALARRDRYRLQPPPGDQGTYRLSPAYTAQAVRVVEPLPAALQSPDLVYMAGSPAAKNAT